MHSDRSLITLTLAGLLLTVVGCGTNPQPTPASSVSPGPTDSGAASPRLTPTATARATATATPTPSPTPEPTIAVEALPVVTLDPRVTTAVCDPYPGQAFPESQDVTLACVDGLEYGYRAIRTVTSDPIHRLYLQRPPCPTAPCSDEALNAATITGWSDGGAWSVVVDLRISATSVPLPAPGAEWPIAASSRVPATKRPSVADAPAELLKRAALPFCGHAEVGAPESVRACFRNAVLQGRPAEMIEQDYGTEGDPVLLVIRTTGAGAVVQYLGTAGTWRRQFGAMTLGIIASAWSFEPLSDGRLIN